MANGAGRVMTPLHVASSYTLNVTCVTWQMDRAEPDDVHERATWMVIITEKTASDAACDMPRFTSHGLGRCRAAMAGFDRCSSLV